MSHIIVVGGGLSGLSACHQIIQRGGNVLLLDKNPFLGGNSTKATSGINGTLTQAQIKHKIPDSVEIFARDTAIGSGLKHGNATPLQQTLCQESGPAIEWLQQYFALDLSLVSQLGGHSFPRTHRGPEKFPGMTITYALMEHLEKIEKETKGKRARTINNARVVKLITEKNAVVGVEYVVNGTTHQAYGPVVLATGGFGADFSKDSILAQVRPDLLNLSTTNGEHCTGDGIKMAQDIGANTVDMDFVQVHPTGLVDPSDPNAKVKFLAAEALRGVGGLLLDAHGNRFVNELATRDYVSEVMGRNKGPFRLVLNGKASKEIEWHCKHYVGRGLMKKLSGPELAKEIGVSAEKLAETFRKYNEGAKHNKDEFGKKYFHNLPFDINDTFHVAQVCPLIHYCMGGLQIDIHGQVLSKKDNKPIAGLFAAGEVTGGVHIKNRLGGSSLTDCVVYGRIAGGTAAAYLFNQLCAGTPLAAAGEPVELNIKLSPSRKTLTLNINYASSTGEQQQQAPAQQEEAAPAAAAAPAPAKPKELKTYTLEEVAKHNKENDVWVVVNGVVLDVTEFKKRHPGGAKAIMLYAGKDATEEFNMLHDANVIEKYAPETIVGTLASSPKAKL